MQVANPHADAQLDDQSQERFAADEAALPALPPHVPSRTPAEQELDENGALIRYPHQTRLPSVDSSLTSCTYNTLALTRSDLDA